MNWKQKIIQLLPKKAQFKSIAISFSAILLLSFLIKLFSFSYSNSTSDKMYQDYIDANYKVGSFLIPANLNFAGETVPHSDFSIKESLDRELLTNGFWHSNSLLLFKRANRWFPIIEPILKKYNVPDDFKYIAIIESHLTNAVSPQGATGFWQLIEPTALNYGLEINDEVDERYNVEKSTEAACQYFLDAHKMFNNWTLAAASYNLGMGGIESQLKKQKVSAYYDLQLNDETSRYVYRILAIKTIMTNPKKFGFVIRKRDLYSQVPLVKIQTDSTINNLVDYAIQKGYTYKIMQLFNPWLRKNKLSNPTHKKYTIVFPTKKFLESSYDELESEMLKSNLSLDSTQYFNLSDTLSKSKIDNNGGLIHKVLRGETIKLLAEKYKVSEQQIRMWNLIDEKSEISEGKEIVIFLAKENIESLNQGK